MSEVADRLKGLVEQYRQAEAAQAVYLQQQIKLQQVQLVRSLQNTAADEPESKQEAELRIREEWAE